MDTTKKSSEEVVPQAKPSLMVRLHLTPAKIKTGLAILGVIGVVGGGFYWYAISQRIYSDKAEIFAPLITLSPSAPSTLKQIFVENGDHISSNQIVAQLDDGETIRAKTNGVIVGINNEVGKLFSPGMPVVTMIDSNDLQLIVHVQENKGLNGIRVGQNVVFTVDAFGSKTFQGHVSEVAQTADQSSVVFSISDKRDEKYFSIKVKFSDYPELLNGMSAKAWIYR